MPSTGEYATSSVKVLDIAIRFTAQLRSTIALASILHACCMHALRGGRTGPVQRNEKGQVLAVGQKPGCLALTRMVDTPGWFAHEWVYERVRCSVRVQHVCDR